MAGGGANSGGGGSADASIGPRALETLGTPLSVRPMDTRKASAYHRPSIIVRITWQVDMKNTSANQYSQLI